VKVARTCMAEKKVMSFISTFSPHCKVSVPHHDCSLQEYYSICLWLVPQYSILGIMLWNCLLCQCPALATAFVWVVSKCTFLQISLQEDLVALQVYGVCVPDPRLYCSTEIH
jgi:hypothetical protein